MYMGKGKVWLRETSNQIDIAKNDYDRLVVKEMIKGNRPYIAFRVHRKYPDDPGWKPVARAGFAIDKAMFHEVMPFLINLYKD